IGISHEIYRNILELGTDFEWAVQLNRYSLELIGLWPKSKRTRREKLLCNSRALITFFAAISILIPIVHSLIKIHSDIILVIDNLQFTLPITTSAVRIVIFWWKKEAITSLTDMMANDWRKPRIWRERTAMIARAQTARVITKCAYCIMIVTVIFGIVMPAYGISFKFDTNITDSNRLLPLPGYYIYDVARSPQYELTYIMEGVFLFLCIVAYTAIDNFLSLMVFHISGQLDILKDRVTRLDQIANFAAALKDCVMDHTRLLRAISIIEDTFNKILLILFLYFGILFACYGALMSNLFQNGNHLSYSGLAYLVIVSNVFGHMCVYCAVGEILTAQCGKIHYAAYYNKWYNLDPKLMRNVVLLMVRSKKPFYLSAGKVFPLTMATFCNVIKTSAGYISVLLTTKS
ncbi:odorant receptor Or2-like, partial [Pseudomyrmex gracilis]|uniref:odorant receptor Or2-like n=1 Tax=Pseudomyrmex gracilis TaxID=219809 RepID=UPI000995920A